MAALQNSMPSLHHTLFINSSPQKGSQKLSLGAFLCCKTSVSLRVHLSSSATAAASSSSHFQESCGRRQIIAAGITAPLVSIVDRTPTAFAAETKKGFLPVTDKKDGYTFLYPFGWQEVVIEGQDKVFKDVIEPLESVSVNLIPTNKEDIRDFGSPQEVADTLIKKVLAPPTQKTKLIQAAEHDEDGKAYYTFEFITRAPNYTRHALTAVSIGNGKFYALTTGANERRWDKMKDRLMTVVDSFKIFNV
ncbi:hypothetical protein HRI_002700000 [Hibiscus trionum]|uniref:PsbP C-terminal domain-containing protein n=1 Tax=Hibiscus trionum TaxID=183268 RepID=A0A9W7I7M4_HIBTR|nr:hypothetical protein HRI_002700000 [Hibiscus trionum]